MNFDQLNVQLLNQVRSLLPIWLPGGRSEGHEYKTASIDGGKGQSLSINLQTGAWAEFAGDLRGGDLISLYAAIKGIKQGEAYRELGGETTSITGDPSMIHPKHGRPSNHWVYRTPAGNPIFWVARYDTADGKQFLPWHHDGKKWLCKSVSTPRPLYGLEHLAAHVSSPVLLVEGEKAADAARKIAAGFVVMTWPNGAKAWSKVDWSPLYKSKVVLWPDADDPGKQAMFGIARLLVEHCPAIKVLDVQDRPAGWDAADAVAEGMTLQELFDWIKPTPVVNVYTLNAAIQIAFPEAVEESAPTLTQLERIERLGLTVNKEGKPICNAGNVAKYSTATQLMVWYDEFSGRIMDARFADKPVAWSDESTTALMIQLQNDFAFHRITSQMVFDGVSFIAQTHKRHIVREWISSLQWDGIERVGMFFQTYFGAEQTATMSAFGNNFWVLLVKRIFQPGCQADYMVVLEGSQGIGKTRAMQIIGGDWYAEVGITADAEDFERQLQGKILVEIAELHSFSKADQSRVKQIITKRIDRYREKYGKIAVDHPRQCVLVGTTNESEWIKDQTGGRRFWPVSCGDIDLDAIQRDRSQLFAEAYQHLKDGDEGYKTPAEDTLELQESRRTRDDWEEVLREKIGPLDRITRLEALKLIGIPEERMDERSARRVSAVLKRLGFRTKTFKIQGEVKRLWTRNGDVTCYPGVTNFSDGV